MWHERTTKPFLVFYLSCLFVATFFLIPTITSFYYYEWGKHLDWSYFDGPPMIAYFFHISNLLFGQTFFSVNIIGFFCLLVSSCYLYRTGCLLLNEQAGLLSALIWLVLPTTTESIFVRVLYDAPLNLFTILSFYYFARYISLKGIWDLYRSAFFIGAMILSKYTAVVSIIGLLMYTILKNKQLFKNVHFYLASLIILTMTFPVISWNANHQWISFTYLLNFHSHSENNASVIFYLLELIGVLLINFSVFLFIAVFAWFKYQKDKRAENNLVLELLYIVLFVGLVFWLVVALLGGDARAIYLTPLGMNLSLIAGYYLTKYDYRRLFLIIYPLFVFFSFALILVNSWPIATYLKKGRAYAVLQKALSQPEVIKDGQPIVTGYFATAAALAFFKSQNTVYALPCGDINQYQYWGADFLNNLSQGKIEKISYIDFRDTKQCAERFFNKCDRIATLSHLKIIPIFHKSTKPIYLYVYECSSPRLFPAS